MNETSDILAATALRLFAEHFPDEAIRASRRGIWPTEGWRAITEAGFPLALVPEDAGGFGLSSGEALNLANIAARFAAPVPLGETMIANWLLARAGLPIAAGPATFAALTSSGTLIREGNGWRLKGEVSNVPWGCRAQIVVIVSDGLVVRLPVSSVCIEPDYSFSGLPRDTFRFDHCLGDADVAVVDSIGVETVRRAGAALRALEIAGALERVLEVTVSYASDRIQFGKPIAKQQAIQHQLAVLATQAAAARAAAEIASLAFNSGRMEPIAVAKSRAAEAAGIGAGIAHQIHGAIGVTEEYRLNLFTKALWAWRDEFGSELFWQERLGQQALEAGADRFWHFVTAVTLELEAS